MDKDALTITGLCVQAHYVALLCHLNCASAEVIQPPHAHKNLH